MSPAPPPSTSLESLAGACANRLHVYSSTAEREGWGALARRLPPFLSLAPRFLARPRRWLMLTRLAALAWWVAYPVLVLAQAFRAVWRLGWAAPGSKLHGSVAVLTTHRLPWAVGRVPEAERPHTWLVVPGVPIADVSGGAPEGSPSVHLHQLTTLVDVGRALRDALAAPRAVGDAIGELHPRARWLTLGSFSWLLAWHVLARTGGEVEEWWFANHYDQWAVLLDRLPVQGRRVQIQHGIEDAEAASHSFPTRIARTRVLYCFDDGAEDFFRSHVFAPTAVDDLEVRCMKLGLDLTPVGPGGPAALIVGSPFEFERETTLVQALRSRFPELRVLVKPHPLFPAENYAALDGIAELITDPYAFPQVDIVLSPLSTLGHEYEAEGVPVVWHHEASVGEVLAAVGEELDRLRLAAASNDRTGER